MEDKNDSEMVSEEMSTGEGVSLSDLERTLFFHSLGGRDDWTQEEKDAFWSRYDDTDVSLAYETGAI